MMVRVSPHAATMPLNPSVSVSRIVLSAVSDPSPRKRFVFSFAAVQGSVKRLPPGCVNLSCQYCVHSKVYRLINVHYDSCNFGRAHNHLCTYWYYLPPCESLHLDVHSLSCWNPLNPFPCVQLCNLLLQKQMMYFYQAKECFVDHRLSTTHDVPHRKPDL